jgi:cytidine deaminase
MNANPLTDAERRLLLKAAQMTIPRAYAPYSGVRVAAAALTAKGKIYPGVNVENASFGLTVCAERAAIFNAVSHEGPEMRLVALAVATDREGSFSPCGACRQVMYEFGPEAVVMFPGREGLLTRRIEELLPEGFRLFRDQIPEATP